MVVDRHDKCRICLPCKSGIYRIYEAKIPVFPVISTKNDSHVGRAKFSKLNGKGSAVLNYVLALLVPVVVHTLYDVCTVFNSSMMRGEMSGILMGLIGYAGLLVYELIVLVRCKKKTAMFCGMSTLAEDAA